MKNGAFWYKGVKVETGAPQEQERDTKRQVQPACLPESLPHSPPQTLPPPGPLCQVQLRPENPPMPSGNVMTGIRRLGLHGEPEEAHARLFSWGASEDGQDGRSQTLLPSKGKWRLATSIVEERAGMREHLFWLMALGVATHAAV